MESPLCPPDDPGFRLIETFGYVPGPGCVRLDQHLARMARSAGVLGVECDVEQARALVEVLDGDALLRCRMTLDITGALDLFTARMTPVQGPWVLKIAGTRLAKDDPWLRHKTTQRQVYDSARAAMPDGVDELIFLNEYNELCEGTITNIFVALRDGRFVTPPLRCGVLPGILRQELITCGQVSEQVVTLDDLRDATEIRVGNSLRGESPARLAKRFDRETL